MDKDLMNSFYTRLILQIILFLTNINPITKIILIFFTDFIDSEIYRLKHPKVLLKYNEEYQKLDKLNDIIGYLLTYYIIFKHKLLTTEQFNILTFVLSYRLLGSYIVYKTNNRKYFLLFIDFYKELFLLFYFVKNKQTFNILFSLIFAIKLYIEYTFHYVTKKHIL